jgi:hypothetical protein
VQLNKKHKKKREGEEEEKSKDHQTNSMDINDIEVVDLRTPVNEPVRVIVAKSIQPKVTIAAAATASSNQTSYESRTLTVNSRRQSILPAFPASIDNDDHPDLLLANVPSK